VTTLNLQISLSQRGLIIPRSTENLEAYDDLLRGTEYLVSDTKDGTIKARPMFEKAIALDSRYSAAYLLLGMDYFQGWVHSFNPDPNGLERAFQLVQQAIALDDSLAVAHSILAAIYVHKGQNDQALAEAQRGITLDANSADSYFWLAEVLNNQSRPTDGLAAAEKAIRLNPKNDASYAFEVGLAYTQLGHWDQAIPAFQTVLKRYPDHLWARAFLAGDYFNQGDQDAARVQTAKVERAAARTPSAMSYAALATTLNFQHKPSEALIAADQGIRLDPHSRYALFQQTFAYTQLGRWKEALDSLKHYVALYPNDLPAHVSLAWTYSALGEMDIARSEVGQVQRLLALDPSSAAYGGLAEVMNDTGKPVEALAAAEKARRLEPKNQGYLYEVGRAYTQLGRWEDSLSAMKGFVRRHPDQIWPHADLIVDYIQLGQTSAARQEVAETLRIDPQFSLKKAVQGEFPAQRERAADLSKAGLI
jgi:tetratricopeptide (TPR) repeat protein